MNKHYDRGYCYICGRRTTHKDNENKYLCITCGMKNIDNTLSEREKEIISKLKKSKLTLEEINSVLSSEKAQYNDKIQPYKVKGVKYKIGVIGDTHIGSKYYDADLMKYAAKIFNEKNVDFVIHGGDICEGHYENKRQGSVFELTEIGGDAQVDRAVKELKQLKKPLYFITGNHEENTFFKMSGFDIGKQIEQRLPNSKYLGKGNGIIELSYNQKIELIHPNDGSSYAISYKPQKIVEQLEGGTKPCALFIFHYHKAMYMYYRNIHTLMGATLQSQTSFMREHGLAAHKGFYVVELEIGKNGVKKFVPEFYPAY